MNNVISITFDSTKNKTIKNKKLELTDQLTLLFWARVDALNKAMDNAEHDDMKNIWKWKLIELMKLIPESK